MVGCGDGGYGCGYVRYGCTLINIIGSGGGDNEN